MTFVTTSTSPFLASERVAGIVHAPTECTVAQAAKFLDGSEGLVNELLEAGLITYRLKNSERLVQWASLQDYVQEEKRRFAEADELFRMFREMGLSDD